MAEVLWSNNTTDGTSAEVTVTGPCTIVAWGLDGCQQVIEARYGTDPFVNAGKGAVIQENEGYNLGWVGEFDVRLRQIGSRPTTNASAVVQGS